MGDKEIRDYVRLILRSYSRYFGRRGVLNSDGMRILNEIIREIAKSKPELLRIAKDVRRNPTLEAFMKLAERVLGDEAYTILNEVINYYV